MGYPNPDLTVVSLSGGLDSTTALASVLRRVNRQDVIAVTFDYGSKHGPLEIAAAKEVAGSYRVSHLILPMGDAFQLSHSALMGKDPRKVPEGHYNDENMAQTVVPARNIIFAGILAGIAQSMLTNKDQKASVVMAMHAGDHMIYPDCRPSCVSNLAAAISFGTDGTVVLETPLLFQVKRKIVAMALEMGAPLHLTRTCYTGDGVACGKCGSCQERLAAFLDCGAEDPLQYQSRIPIAPARKENYAAAPTT